MNGIGRLNLEGRVAQLAAMGRYHTPECNYLAARLEFITAEDPDEAARALDRMVSWVTLTVPDLSDLPE